MGQLIKLVIKTNKDHQIDKDKDDKVLRSYRLKRKNQSIPRYHNTEKPHD